MLDSEKYQYTKMSVKQYILALTLLLSFFATVGYISNKHQKTGVVNTEVLTAKASVFKNGVSFRRALIALDKKQYSFFKPKESQGWALVLFREIAASHYIHLNILFNGYKSMIRFKMINPVHLSRLNFSNIG